MYVQLYLELIFKSVYTSFGVFYAHFLNVSAQVTGTDLCVSTRHGLQNGIVDEDILLLLRGVQQGSSISL